jgi:hypothetical protein
VPQQVCQYCGSPIPVGAKECKSCQMSGEIMRTAERKAHVEGRNASPAKLLALVLLLLVVAGGIAALIYVRLHK